MAHNHWNNYKLSRRKLFRNAGIGLCFFGLSGLSGCTEEDSKEKDAERIKEKTPFQPNEKGDQFLTTEHKKGLVNPQPSPWFSQANDDQLQCELCPKACKLSRGKRSLCRVRENKNGEGYTLAYGNPALLQEDPIERKPFFHVLPGSRALSISTAGCNLSCKFCEVWDMALEKPEEIFAYKVPPENVITLAREAQLRSISYAFGEPVIFYEYMEDTAVQAKKAGFLNLVHTAGYIKQKPLKRLLDKIDAVNIDLKGFDPSFYREIVGGELNPVLETLKTLKDAGKHIEVTHIVIPNLNDDMEKIEEMCQWIVENLGENTPLHFSRFYPLYKLSDLPRTPVSTLEEARETAIKAGLNFVYLAKVTDHEGENTYCPNCGEQVINRLGFVIEDIQLTEGKCSFCDHKIPGIWS